MVYPAQIGPDDGPSHNQRGLFVGGPQFVTASDLLVRLMEQAQLSRSIYAKHFPPSIVEERRARRLYSAREAQRQRAQRRQQEAAA